jgi:hypothetical protein
MKKRTTDVWFVMFLVEEKLCPIHTYQVVERGKVNWEFALTDEQWRQFRVEFQQSKLARLKALQQQLKDMAY